MSAIKNASRTRRSIAAPAALLLALALLLTSLVHAQDLPHDLVVGIGKPVLIPGAALIQVDSWAFAPGAADLKGHFRGSMVTIKNVTGKPGAGAMSDAVDRTLEGMKEGGKRRVLGPQVNIGSGRILQEILEIEVLKIALSAKDLEVDLSNLRTKSPVGASAAPRPVPGQAQDHVPSRATSPAQERSSSALSNGLQTSGRYRGCTVDDTKYVHAPKSIDGSCLGHVFRHCPVIESEGEVKVVACYVDGAMQGAPVTVWTAAQERPVPTGIACSRTEAKPTPSAVSIYGLQFGAQIPCLLECSAGGEKMPMCRNPEGAEMILGAGKENPGLRDAAGIHRSSGKTPWGTNRLKISLNTGLIDVPLILSTPVIETLDNGTLVGMSFQYIPIDNELAVKNIFTRMLNSNPQYRDQAYQWSGRTVIATYAVRDDFAVGAVFGALLGIPPEPRGTVRIYATEQGRAREQYMESVARQSKKPGP